MTLAKGLREGKDSSTVPASGRDRALVAVVLLGSLGLGCSSAPADPAVAGGPPSFQCPATTSESPGHLAQLPNGSCASGACTIFTRDECVNTSALGPLMQYDCSCSDGSWECTGAALSKSACEPICPNSSEQDPVSASVLPDGACGDGDSCTVFTHDPCPSGDAEGPYLQWSCACATGTWICNFTALSKAACPPS
jgi:hypothetical protein